MAKKMKFDKWEIDTIKNTKTRTAEAVIKLNSRGHGGTIRIDALIKKLQSFPPECEVTSMEDEGFGVLHLYLEETITLTPEEIAYERDRQEERAERYARADAALERIRQRSREAKVTEEV